MSPAVDLFTEIRQTPQFPQKARIFQTVIFNILFLNGFILFNYCTEMKMALSDGHLGGFQRAYSQSYPQNLWVSIFPFCSNSLRAYAKNLSSIGRQAFERA